MKKILVLGTGNAQLDLIECCKERGYHVIATSNSAGNRAEKLADEFFQIDITNIDATRELAKEKEVDYVYSVGSDVAMPTVAMVSQQLQLPCFVEYRTACVCNHKQLLREVLAENGVVGNIPFQILERPDDIRIPFPAIMKPSDSQGQRGVYRVESKGDVNLYYEKTMSFSRENKVILESFIDGDEISVNVFLENGEMKFYLISDRKIWDEYPGGLIREHVIPSKYEANDEIMAGIRRLVESVLTVIKLKNGPGYFQIKISSEGKPYLIEVTPRLDGCHMWRAIKHCTGVDLLQASLDLLEKKAYNQPAGYTLTPHSLEFFCGKPESVFDKKNYTIPNNEFLCWYYEDGQTVKSMNGYFEKCGYTIKRN